MRKSLPLWVAIAVPAMLAGHAAAYALAGLNSADARHAWFSPVLECSLAVLILTGTILLAGTFVGARIFARTKIEQSFFAVAPRLAIAQSLLFGAAETLEGAHITLAGIVAQLITAVFAAYLFSLFTRLLARCFATAVEASRYLQRLLAAVAVYVPRATPARASALFACAGPHSFQRPPPQD